VNKVLAIQIPAYNEEKSIEAAINDIPSNIEGFASIELIVINDGSSDKTLEKVKQSRVDHIVNLERHCGLGVAYRKGLEYSISVGADIIVNYDADLQYQGDEIEGLVQPILEKRADAVIGDRQVRKIKGYPFWKACTQTFWSKLITVLFHTKIDDATSGFRAYSRETAELLLKYLQDDYTYSAESIYILAKKKKEIVFVPITIRPTPRKSRLVTNKLHYTIKFAATLFTYLFRKL
jgi:glycosyltransferase involved in cell wall biosynthesis